MPVREVMRGLTSPEVSEWLAYERAYGPVGDAWSDEMLAQIHQILQSIAYMTGAQLEDNPMPKPRSVPRSGFMLEPQEDEDGDNDLTGLLDYFAV